MWVDARTGNWLVKSSPSESLTGSTQSILEVLKPLYAQAVLHSSYKIQNKAANFQNSENSYLHINTAAGLSAKATYWGPKTIFLIQILVQTYLQSTKQNLLT